MIVLAKNPDFNIFNIYLDANKSTIEFRLTEKGYAPEQINKDVLESIFQINIFENNRHLFHFILESDQCTANEMAKKISCQLTLRSVVTRKLPLTK